jgi:hypothetical protein
MTGDKLFDVGTPKPVEVELEPPPPAKVDIGKFSPPLPFTPLAGAVLDSDRVYRYVLWRQFLEKGKTICFVGLNPSTADELSDDPTVTRLIHFAKAWGYARMTLVNIFAFRATNPKELRKAVDPIGKDNDSHIVERVSGAHETVLCYGNGGLFQSRGQVVATMLREGGFSSRLSCFKLTKKGLPWHPLYLPNLVMTIPFSLEEVEVPL